MAVHNQKPWACLPKPEKFEKLDECDFDKLDTYTKLQKKIYAMNKMLSITSEEMYERRRIVADIIDFIRPYYPDCDVVMYGSSLNGFGFPGCDLDLLFLPFPEYCNLDFKGKNNSPLPKPHQILKGIVPRETLLLMEEEMHLKFVQKVMYAAKNYFQRITFIPAKCPILNIELLFSPISCDFSASNKLVMYNTELLWLYSKLDSRVRPLVVILRYWAKTLGFISKNQLSSYCFTLMIIFYLQNVHPPVVPSVKCIIELAGYSRVIDGWECALCLDDKFIRNFSSDNLSPVDKLFVEFFDFYLKFDFIQNVVSPYRGKALPIKKLKESEDERNRSFLVTTFNIQDPFILSKNLGKNSFRKTAFMLSLSVAKKLLCERKFSFQSLFEMSHYESETTSIFASTIKSLSPSAMFLTFQLTYDISYKLGITSQLQPWIDKVSQTVMDILRYGLLIDCEVTDKVCTTSKLERPSKKRKVDCSVENLLLDMSVQCLVNFPTIWKQNRANAGDKSYVKSDNCSGEKKSNKLDKVSNKDDVFASDPKVKGHTCTDDKKDSELKEPGVVVDARASKPNDMCNNQRNERKGKNVDETDALACKPNAKGSNYTDYKKDSESKNLAVVDVCSRELKDMCHYQRDERKENKLDETNALACKLNDKGDYHTDEKKDDILGEVEDDVDVPACLKSDHIISVKLAKGGMIPVSTSFNEKSRPPFLSFTCDIFGYPNSQPSDVIVSFSPLTNKKAFFEVKDLLINFVRKHALNILEKP